mmetsp:Transcript_9364/g.20477  ORF Transcript_9364/g.20477 Transcript_9364/m.20477 type:complete len:214 (+) Transcript_9364:754-1395(+)
MGDCQGLKLWRANSHSRQPAFGNAQRNQIRALGHNLRKTVVREGRQPNQRQTRKILPRDHRCPKLLVIHDLQAAQTRALAYQALDAGRGDRAPHAKVAHAGEEPGGLDVGDLVHLARAVGRRRKIELLDVELGEQLSHLAQFQLTLQRKLTLHPAGKQAALQQPVQAGSLGDAQLRVPEPPVLLEHLFQNPLPSPDLHVRAPWAQKHVVAAEG